MKKALAIQLLENGLNDNLGYGDGSLIEEFFENFDNSCYEIELIPLLKTLASRHSVNFQDWKYFDDNGAGGFLHPTETGKSFKTHAVEAIQIIETNFEKLSPIAKKLALGDAKTLDSALDEIIESYSTDITLIPLLEIIADEDVFLISNSKKKGFGALSQPIYLGNKAKKAIEVIKNNT